MKLLGFVLVISVFILYIWFAIKFKPKPRIVLMTDGAYFKKNKIMIRYNSVLKIEQDAFILGSSANSSSFVITYVSAFGKIDAIRIYLRVRDRSEWEIFKEKVRSGNPNVEFDNSIF